MDNQVIQAGMFNGKSSKREQEQHLLRLLEQEEEDDVDKEVM